jgi:hypothetical protein
LNGSPVGYVPVEVKQITQFEFLFYGYDCTLVEPDEMASLVWFVRFAGDVGPQTRRTVGAELGRSTRAYKLLWADDGPWLTVQLPSIDVDTDQETAKDVQSGLIELHRAVPLAEVICGSMDQLQGCDWDLWSLTQGLPTPFLGTHEEGYDPNPRHGLYEFGDAYVQACTEVGLWPARPDVDVDAGYNLAATAHRLERLTPEIDRATASGALVRLPYRDHRRSGVQIHGQGLPGQEVRRQVAGHHRLSTGVDMVDRTERMVESDHGFAPLTWTLDRRRVEFIWHETAEVFGNSMWIDSICGGKGIPDEWQRELARRKGGSFFSVLVEAIGDLSPDDDPSLVFLALQETCLRYGVTLLVEPHPRHGDVIARAEGLRAGSRSRPERGPVTWAVEEERVVTLWNEIGAFGPGHAVVVLLDEEERDELTLRGGIEVGIALEDAVRHVDEDADPSLTFLALHDYFRDPGKGGVTLEFAPHPEHGDVLARARRTDAGETS